MVFVPTDKVSLRAPGRIRGKTRLACATAKATDIWLFESRVLTPLRIKLGCSLQWFFV